MSASIHIVCVCGCVCTFTAAGSVAGSAASRASSSLLALQQKIDTMEHQLVDARKSRRNMETQLTSLKSSIGGMSIAE